MTCRTAIPIDIKWVQGEVLCVQGSTQQTAGVSKPLNEAHCLRQLWQVTAVIQQFALVYIKNIFVIATDKPLLKCFVSPPADLPVQLLLLMQPF